MLPIDQLDPRARTRAFGTLHLASSPPFVDRVAGGSRTPSNALCCVLTALALLSWRIKVLDRWRGRGTGGGVAEPRRSLRDSGTVHHVCWGSAAGSSPPPRIA
jgi:hypothetical protein